MKEKQIVWRQLADDDRSPPGRPMRNRSRDHLIHQFSPGPYLFAARMSKNAARENSNSKPGRDASNKGTAVETKGARRCTRPTHKRKHKGVGWKGVRASTPTGCHVQLSRLGGFKGSVRDPPGYKSVTKALNAHEGVGRPRSNGHEEPQRTCTYHQAPIAGIILGTTKRCLGKFFFFLSLLSFFLFSSFFYPPLKFQASVVSSKCP